ncbi:hypothetical protein BASA50_004124 [Batrachochytrium salamandrivorans]|uniref:Uncharacterized protein n=1 Tax=Batrachochytrium salamandrivorans TaxID=1357716 RepID=A0ABQ8FJJ6_9FUNG|nr:hypothetical protein BASA50_004124 [Batrachochytrium salamandrivorans]
MQFFHLFSFVVAASYAAALPQPAGLSEKYSSNADATLASGLEARSYQPVLNSYKDSATLVSLKRRDNSEGSTGDNSEGSTGDNSEGSVGDNSEGSVGDNSEGSTGDNSEGSVGDNSEGSTGDNSEGSTGDNSEGSVGDNSEGSTGEDSGSDPSPPSPPPATTPNETFSAPLTKDDVSSKNLASTIDKVEYNKFIFFMDGERAGKKISGDAGKRVAEYLRRATYVSVALGNWADYSTSSILGLNKSDLSGDQYSKIESYLTKKARELLIDFNQGMDAVSSATTNILKDIDSVAENIEKIKKAFGMIFESRMVLLWNLRFRLRFEAGKTLERQLVDANRSYIAFLKKQNTLYAEIKKDFGITSIHHRL